jgi:predicted amidohydrolase
MGLDRRQFLRLGLGAAATAFLSRGAAAAPPNPPLRIALLHLAPIPGEVAHNRRLVETAVLRAAEHGATWIVTPELCVTGYTFADRIGVTWILPQPDPWMEEMRRLASRLGVTLFLSHPERDPASGNLYNSLFVIDAQGTLLGRHRKIHALRVGSEGWSSPGEQPTVLPVRPFQRVGLLICADAYGPEICRSLKAQGAELLVSAAAWAPGLHGPSGEWERCTEETGLPLLVCNRTGPDRTLDFTKAETVVVQGGKRLLSLSSDRSAVFVIDWDPVVIEADSAS